VTSTVVELMTEAPTFWGGSGPAAQYIPRDKKNDKKTSDVVLLNM